MKKKLTGACLGIFVLAMGISMANVYAYDFRHSKQKCGGEIDGMFYKKAHMILENYSELGIPEETVEKTKNLQLETNKAVIRQNAEIEIVSLDLAAKLHEYPVDVETVNKLVDQQYELKKAKAKSVVGAITQLKSILTKEQYEKLRKLWKGGLSKEDKEKNPMRNRGR
ncbi:MAG: hypothetical protein A3G33_00170 [Omnitrophica bacterium RIFCSPLOWO2_12_FULL_44_17]|uniref:Periplasmic heavy metal sensor n=1 Tax=Candidatus Danuiimicrobium aquiferis TaxID=1801832 RepID=A0A1G1KTC8_9BACT|nr:MAG: hypothetical protein A3B72_00255 [Omnitrophica bacterium RIFCSPHIGHO2_02_FULL_45_28]OGW91654.1 MAG: hypothetical protein A3E74_00270 [Omnitrophica bacterium RIFCSPHIGHO2_12_FULL_44_12]OGW96213.1 MAG: hypothetical protein A3G33_00170 [Omnitrophica bacterium RIFCSPLOWO2_12_FULL_44_17]OGX02125.1 MAG: hypothetical protein A3J12_01750 [Omnitrophica bacterium RIFCSPLOWO2_02_FULL_44_11]